MQINPSFQALDMGANVFFRHGDLLATSLMSGQAFTLSKGGSYFVFVHEGLVVVNETYAISTGMYAVMAGGEVQAEDSTKALMVHHPGVDAMFLMGGPVEDKGRLRYIDGCTDSLLVPPVKLGDPCLNYLHFPPGIRQTMHTHPSLRLGIVFGGSGLCVTPFGNAPLVPGMVFAIMPEDGTECLGNDGLMHKVGEHCFHTYDEEMRIVAFHPDSDYGPTDEAHPMINRTIVGGVSAAALPALHTR